MSTTGVGLVTLTVSAGTCIPLTFARSSSTNCYNYFVDEDLADVSGLHVPAETVNVTNPMPVVNMTTHLDIPWTTRQSFNFIPK